MKITKSQLRQIIKEQMEEIQDDDDITFDDIQLLKSHGFQENKYGDWEKAFPEPWGLDDIYVQKKKRDRFTPNAKWELQISVNGEYGVLDLEASNLKDLFAQYKEALIALVTSYK